MIEENIYGQNIFFLFLKLLLRCIEMFILVFDKKETNDDWTYGLNLMLIYDYLRLINYLNNDIQRITNCQKYLFDEKITNNLRYLPNNNISITYLIT